MPVATWSDRFLIGIPQIDKHHQHLFSLMNRTYDDFIGQASIRDLTALFDELIDYATYHMAMEEYWMEESRFPGFAKHKQEHDVFSGRVREMHRGYHNGERHLVLEVLSFLYEWFLTHILKADAEYGRFMAAKNSFHPEGVNRGVQG